MNYSPLRYPGGKAKIASLVQLLINKARIQHTTYVEPFAGGAGVALSLLMADAVDQIVINDYDKAIYSIWRAIKEDTNAFIELIRHTPVTIEEWQRQKEIYIDQKNHYSLELAFATFFLNRTNRSGILNAGPIGGYDQTGNYLIHVRFNRDSLIKKVKAIAEKRNRIFIYNKDIRSFLNRYLPRYQNVFIYLDPPYYRKGQKLYQNFFTEQDHRDIADLIKVLNCNWMVTYDDVPQINELYSQFTSKKFDLSYSLANKSTKSEVMFLCNPDLWPTIEELQQNNIHINLR